MSCDLKPCPDLSNKKIEIYNQFGNSVYQSMVTERYGLESCVKTKDLDLIAIRKELVDWQTLEDNFTHALGDHPGLGRIYAYDPRDANYLVKDSPIFGNAIRPGNSQRTSRYWDAEQWWGHQGMTSECVGYSWVHWLEDGPFYQASSPHPIANPSEIYRIAQKIDEYPGEEPTYYGTSIRAGAKVLQQMGFISNYYWAYDVNTLANIVLNIGPVVAGTWWYAGMSRLGAGARMTTTGRLLGGHAYVVNGVDTRTRMFRIKNSWGKQWGQGGHGFISFADMSRLIRMKGEICIATEIKP